jgi:glycosyltransferase involved in cell wall biosynthesis
VRIAIVTDAWEPQVNGVVTTLSNTARCLEQSGHIVSLITPHGFRTIPAPTYPSIRLALRPENKVRRTLTDFAPDAIHIATEGPLGLATRRHCKRLRLRFTTSYHTRFPEYIRMRLGLPVSVSYAWLRRFHAAAERTFVATESQRRELGARGFENLVIWPRGVDTEVFQSADPAHLKDPRPIAMYAGRVATEKTWKSSCRWSYPAQNTSWATAQTSHAFAVNFRACDLPATSIDASWQPISRPRMCSYFPAAATPSGW